MNRRLLFKTLGLALLSVPFVGPALSASIKMITPKIAKRLKYVEDVEKSGAISKKYKKGQLCLNCKYYKRGKKKEDGSWSKEKTHDKALVAKCQMASSKYVNRKGHCHVYSWDKKKFPKI